MKQLLTFLCALLFALAGKAAPAGDELKQLLAEARAIVNTAGNALSLIHISEPTRP